eukprot:TRINITY_DN22844_c0_g5_i4.p1 TRINITY_DN22844_c0_g5~~TRINITY_DN22844_c0_g5_i4.p1  ORF type:complete len:188 (+),score=64.88 TRINITY_DN22844_c0_g5_i4:2-565(+)
MCGCSADLTDLDLMKNELNAFEMPEFTYRLEEQCNYEGVLKLSCETDVIGKTFTRTCPLDNPACFAPPCDCVGHDAIYEVTCCDAHKQLSPVHIAEGFSVGMVLKRLMKHLEDTPMPDICHNDVIDLSLESFGLISELSVELEYFKDQKKYVKPICGRDYCTASQPTCGIDSAAAYGHPGKCFIYII